MKSHDRLLVLSLGLGLIAAACALDSAALETSQQPALRFEPAELVPKLDDNKIDPCDEGFKEVTQQCPSSVLERVDASPTCIETFDANERPVFQLVQTDCTCGYAGGSGFKSTCADFNHRDPSVTLVGQLTSCSPHEEHLFLNLEDPEEFATRADCEDRAQTICDELADDSCPEEARGQLPESITCCTPENKPAPPKPFGKSGVTRN